MPLVTTTEFFTVQCAERSFHTALSNGSCAKVSLDEGTQKAGEARRTRSKRRGSGKEEASFDSGDHQQWRRAMASSTSPHAKGTWRPARMDRHGTNLLSRLAAKASPAVPS